MKHKLLGMAAAAVFAAIIFSGCAESTEIPAGTVPETTESSSAGLDTAAETTFEAVPETETETAEEPTPEDVPPTRLPPIRNC